MRQVLVGLERLMFAPWSPQGMRQAISSASIEPSANTKFSAYVCIGDPNVEKGSMLEKELHG